MQLVQSQACLVTGNRPDTANLNHSCLLSAKAQRAKQTAHYNEYFLLHLLALSLYLDSALNLSLPLIDYDYTMLNIASIAFLAFLRISSGTITSSFISSRDQKTFSKLVRFIFGQTASSDAG